MSHSHGECACANVKVNANRCVDNCRGVRVNGCVRIKVGADVHAWVDINGDADRHARNVLHL